ncbi:MAG TPA: cold shock domain-containing protein [Burkholderiales bacterium]
MVRERGIVKWFSESRGYGFIVPQRGGDDVFAHYSAIEMEGYRTLREGQLVEFQLEEGPRGREAWRIRAIA